MAKKNKINLELVKMNYHGKEIEHYIRDSFVLYTNSFDAIELLSDEQAGRLFKSIFYYNMGQLDEFDEIIGNDREIKMCLAPIKNYMDANSAEYESKCKTNQENAKKAAEMKRKIAVEKARELLEEEKEKNSAGASASVETGYDNVIVPGVPF